MTSFDDLPSMALFAQVVQLRSFSQAARAVGIAKSAVSRRITLLEDKVGVRLLVRTTRRLALTNEGLAFYQHCAEMVAAARAAEEAVGHAQSARGVIRLNASVAFAELYLARAIAAFLAERPGIEVQLTIDDRLVDLAEGGADLLVRVTQQLRGVPVARKLAHDRMVVVAAPAYLERAGAPATPAELVHHNCLRYALLPASAEWRFRDRGKVVAVPVGGNFVASNGAILREAAVAGLGVAVLPRFMVAPALAAGRLVTLLDDEITGELGVYAVLPARAHLPARTRLLVEHLARHFARADWAELAGPAPAPPPTGGATRSAPPRR